MSRSLRFDSLDAMPQRLRERIEAQQATPAARPPTRPRQKRPRRDKEHNEQVVLFNRIRTLALNDARYSVAAARTFAIPNGGGRSKAEAGRLKAEGVTAGVSDVFVALPVGNQHGLWIEMKRADGGRTSKEQEQWLEDSRSLGYAGHVCHGADAAWQVWLDYVHGAL